ncbi:MAG: T9SS type A sorting domain-containing protein [Phycisphaerae bacterium]|nr:T9SS type A sorting domain-containing protein [Saprospiraceae bacterium]
MKNLSKTTILTSNKHLLLSLLLFLFIGYEPSAQTVTPQVVASCGGFGGSAAGTVSYTLGELATTTKGSAIGILTQGFQQPEPFGNVSTDEPDLLENLTLFPNPSTMEVSLSFTSKKAFSATWEILTVEGRKVLTSEKIKAPSGKYLEKINLSQLPAATYFFQLKIEGGSIRTARLVKL